MTAADKAYGNQAFRDKLAKDGVKDGLMYRAARNACAMHLMCAAINLRRALVLAA